MAKSQNRIQVAARNLMIYFLLLATLSFSALAPAQESTPDIETIITHIDQLYRSQTSHAEMEMHIVTPHWERTLAMTIWTQGMDKTFIRHYRAQKGTRGRDTAHRKRNVELSP